MAVFLLRGEHGTAYIPPKATGNAFGDVQTDHWAADWIEALFGEGITAGCTVSSPPNYCPENAVNRAQMAIFLLRAKYGTSYSPPPATGIFEDVPAGEDGHWAAAWIEALFAEGITAGCTSGVPPRYCPENPVTRAQMAVFLVRTFGLAFD
jgi:hypothetical protein